MFAAIVHTDAAPPAQQKKPTAKEKMAKVVRFLAVSNGLFFPIRMKETANGWSYKYIDYFETTTVRQEPPGGDATFTKNSDTEYTISGPTYPENGKQVTEHHSCHKLRAHKRE